MCDKEYYDAQGGKFKDNPENGIGFPRKEAFIKLIIDKIDKDYVKKILLVGCSNEDEKNIFTEKGFDAIGIDLHPGKNIIKMDMHKLEFPDNSFDMVVFSHSFEHSYNPNVVLAEVKRVLTDRGYLCIEVPVNRRIDKIDRFDFVNYNNLYRNIISPIMECELIFGWNYKLGDVNNFCGTDIAKLIVRRI